MKSFNEMDDFLDALDDYEPPSSKDEGMRVLMFFLAFVTIFLIGIIAAPHICPNN